MSKSYGLPYKGSKSKIAPLIVSLFPKRNTLYDLFMGGGAITHYAMNTRKFKNVVANDINWMCPQLFKDALEGKYDNESRWISREDFERLKDTDPYVAFVWSFGNNLRDYIYGRDVEPIKKALHYVLFFQDDTYAKELGFDLSEACQLRSIDARYKVLKQWLGGGKEWVSSNIMNELEESAECTNVKKKSLNPNIQHYTSAKRVRLAWKRYPSKLSIIRGANVLPLSGGVKLNFSIQTIKPYLSARTA